MLLYSQVALEICPVTILNETKTIQIFLNINLVWDKLSKTIIARLSESN